MDRMLYVMMSGTKETLLAQAVNANNLANISTIGFLADLAQARSMPVQGEGLPTRVFALTERPATDLTPGTVTTTNRDLDVAINGSGWIAVQTPQGDEAYTRAGDLRLSETGLLVTGAGHPVLGNGGPVTIPPAENLEIGRDGTISLLPAGQPANTRVSLDRIKLVDPQAERMEKGADGLMRITGNEPVPADGGVTLISGALESSNVNAVDALVSMISLARRFEMQVKMMRVAEENDARDAQVLKLG